MDRRIFIGLGSNLGDSSHILLEAWHRLGQLEGVECVQLSSPYVTAPVDMQSQHWFTNAVGELRSALPPHELLETMLDLETELGRVRNQPTFGYQDRMIDLDILFYGDLTLDDPDLVLPHPHLYDRLFVLTPLAEIAPDYFDSTSGRTVRELEKRLLDKIDSGRERSQDINRTSWDEGGLF